MKMDELTKRKTPRCQSFDYNSVGAYFITVCTQNRQSLLSRIVGTGVLDCPQIELTAYGNIADKYIKQLNDFYDHLSVEEYVIMPNHIHLLLVINENKSTSYNGQSGRCERSEEVLLGYACPYKYRESEQCMFSIYIDV